MNNILIVPNDWTMLDHGISSYVDDVLSGKEIAGEALILACLRFKTWYTTDKYWFDHDRVNRAMDCAEHLTLFDDEFYGKQLKLERWLKFLFANIFGWYRHEDHDKRVIRNAFLLISRKSAKTSTSAAIALADMITSGVHGGEIYLVSNTREQAKVSYKFIKGFSEGLDPKLKFLKYYRDNLIYTKNNTICKVLSSDADTTEGTSPSLVIVDEYHAAKNNDSYNSMKSGMAARKNPLMLIITSAGYLLDGYPCYETWKVGMDVLRGLKQDDSWFYLFYQLDEKDDWRDKSVWKKSCPMLGISTHEDYMDERVLEATNDTSKETDVLTKNFNKWCSSAHAWISNEIIVKSMKKVDLNEFKGEQCWIGVDLSETDDLTAISILLPPNPDRERWKDKYIFKTMVYIPPIAMQKSRNRSIYSTFILKGEAYLTTGEMTVNYDEVLRDIMAVNKNMDVVSIAFDKYNARNFLRMAEEEGFTMESYGQSLLNFNIPTKTFTELMLNGKVILDKSSSTSWMFGNVELKHDHNNNMKPVKSGDDKLKKIDGVIAILEALGSYLINVELCFYVEN